MRFLLLAIIIICNIQGAAALTPDEASALNQRGRDFLAAEPAQPDSAIACFRRVADAYSPDLSLQMRELCGTAANNLGYTYYQYIPDYKSAYEVLTLAERICETTENPHLKGNVWLNQANMYAIYSELANSPEFEKEAIGLYRKVFRTAAANKFWDLVCVSFCNLTEIGQDFRHLPEIQDVIDDYGRLDIPESTPLSHYTDLRYNSIKAYQKNDFRLATSLTTNSLENIDDAVANPWKIQTLNLAIMLYLRREMPDSARYYADIMLQSAESVESVSLKVYSNKMLKRIYEQLGDSANTHEAYVQILINTDSLMNSKNLNSINNLKFINDLAAERRDAAEKVAEADGKRLTRERFLIIAGIILVVLIPVLIMVLKKLSRLRRRYEELYRRQQEVLKQEEENRRQRDAEMQNLQKKEKGNKESSSAASTKAMSQKTKILAVMDETDEIFSTDFSLDRLSELADINPRSLSAILNNHLGTTFRDLLNQYRVREACKRLSDQENYGQFTIEAISQSLGYKSRTSLISAFKKETGLTPSEYQKMARKSKS